MSIQTISNYQNLAQYTFFSEVRKTSRYSYKPNLTMAFLSAFITVSKKKREPNEDNFPKDRYWQCKKCDYMNLISVWKCGLCGTAR